MSTLDVDVAGANWRVELAPLTETLNSGLLWGVVNVAHDIIAIGSLSTDGTAQRLQAARIVVNGVIYDLYPDRIAGLQGARPDSAPITSL